MAIDLVKEMRFGSSADPNLLTIIIETLNRINCKTWEEGNRDQVENVVKQVLIWDLLLQGADIKSRVQQRERRINYASLRVIEWKCKSGMNSLVNFIEAGFWVVEWMNVDS